MLDEGILALYFNRDEAAIGETRTKYGRFCTGIAMNILGAPEDAEECVSDTYLAAWNRIPPERPESLRAFLGRITRNLSISRYRKLRAGKRYAPLEQMLTELSQCVPVRQAHSSEIERWELGELISRWLDTLPEGSRTLFIRRYWYGLSVQELARIGGERPNTVSQRLVRLREKLRETLEEEGVSV